MDTETTTVGVLLPLSGAKQKMGNSIRKGIELAYYRESPKKLQLLIRDTEGNPVKARQQFKTISQAHAVLGPVFGEEVEAIIPDAQDNLFITFNNNPSLKGNKVVILAPTYEDETKFILETAVQAGMKRFAAILPDNEFGQRLKTVYEKVLEDLGAENVRINFYSKNNMDMYAPVASLRQEEIDAIFVPEGGPRLKQIKIEMRSFRIPGRLLGLSLWEDTLPKGIRLTGAWYATPRSTTKEWFKNYYKNTYGTLPTIQAALGFDAMSLLLTLRKTYALDPYNWSNLTYMHGFKGVGGEFVVQSSGLVNRKVSIMQITNSMPIVVSSEE